MRHIIKRQVLELRLVTNRDMFKMQQKASQYYYSQILPALEKMLNTLTDQDHVIQIDRLELDLGMLKWEEDKQEMNADNLYHLLEEQIQQAVKQIHLQNYLSGSNNNVSRTMGKPVSLHACEQWLLYLRNGYLSWDVTEVNDVWRTHVLEALSTDYTLVSELRLLIEKDSNALQRLVHEHPVTYLVKIVEVLTAKAQQSLPQLVNELHQVLYSDHPEILPSIDKHPRKKEEILWKQILKGAANGRESMEIARELLSEYLRKNNRKESDILKKELPILHAVIESYKKLPLSPNIPERDSGSSKGKQLKKNLVEKNDDKAINRIQGTKKEGFQGDEHVTDAFIRLPEDGIFTPHAGLILLHPFFKSLLNHLGITRENHFISTQLQEKAVAILHFIATGQTDAEEYQLVVPKILCNYPLEQSLSREVELNETDKTEALDMIKAAIEQWSILKNTSPDGLREGFLNRNGKIYTKDRNICFVIESHAIDVLLDHLPWNLSIVKLPWIKEMIKVEWR